MQKFKAAKTVQDCKLLTEMVNFLSMLCPSLQNLLKGVHDLTRKSKPFMKTKSIKMPLRKSRANYWYPLYFLCQTIEVDINYSQASTKQ